MIFVVINEGMSWEGNQILGAFETFAAARNAVEDHYKLEQAERRGELSEDEATFEELYISHDTLIIEYHGFEKKNTWEWDLELNWTKRSY